MKGKQTHWAKKQGAPDEGQHANVHTMVIPTSACAAMLSGMQECQRLPRSGEPAHAAITSLAVFT